MKKLTCLCLLLIGFGSNLFSQPDTLPPYKQVPIIPPFKILLPDSSWFTKAQLDPKKTTWVVYFSPDCGHCIIETEQIITNMSKLKKLQIVMITSRPFEDMKYFNDHFLLSRFPNIKVGRDPIRFVPEFYKVETTPFNAVYNKKGNLVKDYRDGVNIKEMIEFAK